MSQDLYPKDSAEPETYDLPVFLLGTGAAAPTLQNRNNVTVTRTGVGAYTLTFADDPGHDVGGTYGFKDTSGTLTNSAGWSVVLGALTAASDSTPASLPIQVANASHAAADLAATQQLKLQLEFKRASMKL